MNAKERLNAAQDRLNQLDPNNRDNLAEIARLKTEIAELVKQVAAEESEEEAAAREQKVHEQIGEYHDTLTQIFDALFPGDLFKSVLGLTEYEKLRQDYMRVHSAYQSDLLSKIASDHTAESEEWRGKYVRLNEKLQDTEKQLLDATREINDLKEENEKSVFELSEIRRERDELQAKLDAQETRANELENALIEKEREIDRLKQEKDELQTKLEQSHRQPVQTEKLNQVLGEIKSRNQMSADELIKRFEDRMKNGGKVMSIEHGSKKLELPEFSFRPMDKAAVQDITEQQFRGGGTGVAEPATGAANGAGERADQDSEKGHATLSLEDRVAALEARVSELERQRGVA
jgi:chromosome segregation ATPase